MVNLHNTPLTEILNPIVRERKDVIEQELEKVVYILGEDSKCLIPLVSNFDPLLREFDKVLTDLSYTNVTCKELDEKLDQSSLYVKTLKQQKKSIELRTVELEALHQAELRRWTEEKKQLERKIEDLEWTIDHQDSDISRLTKLNSDLQKQISNSAEQLHQLKKTRNITRKFSSAVRLVKQQKDADVTQRIIQKLEEETEVYNDRFTTLDSENSALARQLEEAHDMIEELRLRDEMMAKERREWKVEREDLLEETVHLKAQLKLVEADLAKHHNATKNLQSQIRKAEADIKQFESEAKRYSDENQFLESQMVRMKNILISEGISLEKFPEITLKIPDSNMELMEKLSSSPHSPGLPLPSPSKQKNSSVSDLSRHEISLQDELDLEGGMSGEKHENTEMEELEIRNSQLEQEIMRLETEKNALSLDVRRAEKTVSQRDRELMNYRDEVKLMNNQLGEMRQKIDTYQDERETNQLIRSAHLRRSLRRSDSAISDPDSETSENLFEENMQLIKEKQVLFEKVSQLEAEFMATERQLKSEKNDAERKVIRLQEDFEAVKTSETNLMKELAETKFQLDRLKCLYNLLQSEENEGEDPEDLVARLKYKRGEVEALLRDRKEMRAQIVSLQKTLNMKMSEDNDRMLNGGFVARVLSAIRKRRRSVKTVNSTSALESIARVTSSSIGKDLGYSTTGRSKRRRPSLGNLRNGSTTTPTSPHRVQDLKDISSTARKVCTGWTFSPIGIFSTGLPVSVPVYSKLMILDERPQKIICSSFVPYWPYPKSSEVRIVRTRAKSPDRSEGPPTPSSRLKNKASLGKDSFEGRDSSNKSKDSSTRGSTRSMESKDSIRSTRSMEGKSNFPLMEEVVMETDNVAMGMLCMASFKPLTAVGLDTTVSTNVNAELEDRLSAMMFSQSVIKNSVTRLPSAPLETQTNGEVTEDVYVEEKRGEELGGAECTSPTTAARRELFRQTKDAFYRKPTPSPSPSPTLSQSLYPYLWVVGVDDNNLSFLHVLNLNFPARVVRSHFLCEGKVNTIAIIKNNGASDNIKIAAKKVYFGYQSAIDEWSCWMGTTDGRLFIIELNETHQQVYTKNFSDSVHCITYQEPYVFVSLKNGALVTYNRDKEGRWAMENYQITVIDTTGKKVRRVEHINDKIWCGCGPTISIYNPFTYRIDEKVEVVLNSSEKIRDLIHVRGTVWVSLANSTKLVIVAAQTKDLIRVISLKGYILRVGRRHGLDLNETDIYITTIFYDGSLVWIGTNIGVILTILYPVPVTDCRPCSQNSNLSSLEDELAWDSNDNFLANTSSNHDNANTVNSTKPVKETNNSFDKSFKVPPEKPPRAETTNGKSWSRSRGSSLTNSDDGDSRPVRNFDKEATFDYDCTEEPSKTSVSNISEDIENMLASFDIDAQVRASVSSLQEDHILFSIYGNQGPASSFCRIEGDEDIPSLFCSSGIGFDDYDVKGLKMLRTKESISADSPSDPRLLSQLLIWAYSR